MLKKIDNTQNCTQKYCKESYDNQVRQTLEEFKKNDRLKRMIIAKKTGNTNTIKKITDEVSSTTKNSKEYKDYVSCIEKNCANKIHELYNEFQKSLKTESFKDLPKDTQKKMQSLKKELNNSQNDSIYNKMMLIFEIMSEMQRTRMENMQKRKNSSLVQKKLK